MIPWTDSLWISITSSLPNRLKSTTNRNRLNFVRTRLNALNRSILVSSTSLSLWITRTAVFYFKISLFANQPDLPTFDHVLSTWKFQGISSSQWVQMEFTRWISLSSGPLWVAYRWKCWKAVTGHDCLLPLPSASTHVERKSMPLPVATGRPKCITKEVLINARWIAERPNQAPQFCCVTFD